MNPSACICSAPPRIDDSRAPRRVLNDDGPETRGSTAASTATSRATMVVVRDDEPAEKANRGVAVPPLAEEDHVCPECGLCYAQLSVESAVELIRAVPTAVRETVAGIPASAHRWRPGTGAWSVVEYVCHVRDVYAVSTIRLHRARTEDRPVLEPMLNDLRARRFRYNERDVGAVLDELDANAAGFCDEADRVGPGDWARTVTRLPGEQRTARWLVRQAVHEGQHHLGDIRRLGQAAGEVPNPD